MRLSRAIRILTGPMAHLLGLWLILAATLLTGRNAQTTREDASEFCQLEVFRATCPPEHVIIMKAALYGRMRHGRCVKRDYGYVGCFVDVRMLADMRCSGRQECQISVPDKLLDGTNPCPEDLKMYLLATYECRKVSVPENPSECGRSGQSVVRGPEGLLSSYVTDQTGCGDTDRPWVIQAAPGQRINITLLDFAPKTAVAPPNGTGKGLIPALTARPSSHCHVYAIVKDLGSQSTQTLCGGSVGDPRVRHVLYSEGHMLEIRFITSTRRGHFLLRYEVAGCPDLDTPQGGWFKRDGSVATMGCQQDGFTWTLTCKGSQWVGQMPNCSVDEPRYPGGRGAFSRMGNFTQPSAFLLIIGIAFIIGFLILLVGLVILRRYKRPVFRSHGDPRSKPDDRLAPAKNLDLPPCTKSDMSGYTRPPPALMKQDGGSSEDNEYAYVDDYQIDSIRAGAMGTGTGNSGVPRDASRPIYTSGGDGSELLAFQIAPSVGEDCNCNSRPANVTQSDLFSMDGTMYRLSEGKGLQTLAARSGQSSGQSHSYHVLDQADRYESNTA